MRFASCVGCDAPVLELEEQFEKLDLFYILDEIPPADSAGWWHSSCLSNSEVGQLWCNARLQNFRDVRRYQEIAAISSWTILQDPNRGKRIAFGQHAELLGLSLGGKKHARAVEGGYVFPVVEDEFHLEWDADVVEGLKRELEGEGRVSLVRFLEELHVADWIVNAVALERAAFSFVPKLEKQWRRGVLVARLDYGLFVPEVLFEYVGELIR